MLLDRNISNKETANLIHELADIEKMIALLDITGDGTGGIERVPAVPYEIPEVPSDWEFTFDETRGGLREGIGGLLRGLEELRIQQGENAAFVEGEGGIGVGGGSGGKETAGDIPKNRSSGGLEMDVGEEEDDEDEEYDLVPFLV
jgi:hypothetical protein